MYSQSTYKEPLFCSSWFALCSSAEKTAGLGAGNGFFHCFQKAENYPHANFQRHYSDQSPEITQQRSPSEIRHMAPVAPNARPLPGCDSRQDRCERECCQSEGSSLTSYSIKGNRFRGQGGDLLSHWASQRPAFAHPAQGHLHSLLCSPGRHPSYCQGACGLERVRGWAPVPTGLLHHMTNCKSQTQSRSLFSHLWSGGVGPDDFQ